MGCRGREGSQGAMATRTRIVRTVKTLVPAPLRPRLRRALRRAWFPVRRATACSRPLPDFIIPGAMKAGTTSLFRYLAQHPRILPSSVKEVHYFDASPERGEAWYRAHFPLARRRPPGSLSGEASPYYLFDPRVAERMAALIPKVKLVVLLRDPTERAISHYLHAVRMGFETLPLFEALQAEEGRMASLPARERDARPTRVWHSYKSRGHYAEQLARYLEHFPSDQILVLPSEPFFEDPRPTLATVLDFLGLPDHMPAQLAPLNAGGGERPVEPRVRAYLDAYFAPHNEALRRLLGRDFGW